MRYLLISCVLPFICATAYAQSTSNAAASTSGIGNQQSINFITPGESNAVLDSRYSGSYTGRIQT